MYRPILVLLSLSLSCTGSSAPTTGTLAGTAKDPAGVAVAGAGLSTTPATTTVQTDAAGAWTLDAVPPGDYTVRAEKTGFSPAEVPGVHVVAGQTASVDLILSPVKVPPALGSITGTVAETSTGKPIPKARVSLQPVDLVTESDTAGTFGFEEVAAGSYQVSATAKGFADGQPVPVVVEPGKQAKVSLALATTDAPVSSCVTCHSDLDRIQADLAANPPPVPPGGADLGEC